VWALTWVKCSPSLKSAHARLWGATQVENLPYSPHGRAIALCGFSRDSSERPEPLSVCVRTRLSPLRGLNVSHLYPRLAPWAAFLRRFAADNRTACSTASSKFEFSRTHLRALLAGLFLYCLLLQDLPVARQPNKSTPLPHSQFRLQFIGTIPVVIPYAAFARDPISELEHL